MDVPVPNPILIKVDKLAWQAQGLCVGKDPNMWEPAEHGCRPDPTTARYDKLSARAQGNIAAINLCNACPVRNECLQYALDTKQEFLIFGGTWPHEREQMR